MTLKDNKNVLVTGGAGFIGGYTVKLLQQEGFNIIIADKKEKPDNIVFPYYKIDVSTPDTEKIFKSHEIDYVIHLAAHPSVADSIRDPLNDCKDNYMTTVNVCTLAVKYGVKKLIFSSTAAVYAHPEYLPVDENSNTGYLSPYAINKKASEDFIKFSGVNYLILRYSNVYGKGQTFSPETGVITKFVHAMTNNNDVIIYGDGSQSRDFIHVEDVAKVNTIALLSDVKNEIINVSSNKKLSINKLFSMLKENYNYFKEPIYYPARQGDIKDSVLSNEKMLKLLKYAPKIPIEEGIKTLS